MKQEIRQEVLSRLKRLATQKKKKNYQEEELLSYLYATSQWKQAKVIATTYPMAHEFDTTKLIRRAFKEDKIIVIPKTRKLGEMDFHQYDQTTELEKTKFGVYEPVNSEKYDKQSIDLMIVPGVGFTRDKKRIGYGGGFYDRYLTNFYGETISLAFEEQLVETLDTEPHDKKVDTLICINQGELYEGI